MNIRSKRNRDIHLPSILLLLQWISQAPTQARRRRAETVAFEAIQEAWNIIEPPAGAACAEIVRTKNLSEFLSTLDGKYDLYDLKKLGFLCAFAFCILHERDTRH